MNSEHTYSGTGIYYGYLVPDLKLGSQIDPMGTARFFSPGTLKFMFGDMQDMAWGEGAGGAQNDKTQQAITKIFDMLNNGATIDDIISFAKNDGSFEMGIGSPGASGNDQNHLSDNEINVEKRDYKVDITKGTNDTYQYGITINFTYLGDLSKYKNVDFIQSIVTDYGDVFSMTNDYLMVVELLSEF